MTEVAPEPSSPGLRPWLAGWLALASVGLAVVWMLLLRFGTSAEVLFNTALGRHFWFFAALPFPVFSLVLASLFCWRTCVLLHGTALVVALAIMGLLAASWGGGEAALVPCAVVVFYLAPWLGFYFLCLRSMARLDVAGDRLPTELALVHQLAKGASEEIVREHLGEPCEVLVESGAPCWRYGGRAEEMSLRILFTPDRRYQRFELD